MIRRKHSRDPCNKKKKYCKYFSNQAIHVSTSCLSSVFRSALYSWVNWKRCLVVHMYRKMLFYIWVYCTYIRCNFPCLIYFSIGVEYMLRFVVCFQEFEFGGVALRSPCWEGTDLGKKDLVREQALTHFQGERVVLFKKYKTTTKKH